MRRLTCVVVADRTGAKDEGRRRAREGWRSSVEGSQASEVRPAKAGRAVERKPRRVGVVGGAAMVEGSIAFSGVLISFSDLV